MHTKESLLFNQKFIDQAIIKIRDVYKPNDGSTGFYYRSSMLVLKTASKKVLKSKSLEGTDYFLVLIDLTEKINELSQKIKSDKDIINKQIRIDYLRNVMTILNNAIEAFHVHVKEQRINGSWINTCQGTVEQIIRTNFDPTFALPQPLSLAEISKEYNTAYDKEYGQSTFGFFKLPIKRFFQQKTRTDELKFLEDIEACCQKNTRLDDSGKNLLRLTAANLVSTKISTETFGNGSILGKILKSRISDSGHESNEMIVDFINQCNKLRVRVPEHLKNLYENDLTSEVQSQQHKLN